MNIVHHDAHKEIPKAELRQGVRHGFVWIVRGGTMLIILLGFAYLMLLNSLATQGFVLQEIKAERLIVQKELEEWDIALAIPTSLYALQSSEQVQEMEWVNNRDFVRTRSGELALVPSKNVYK